MFRAARAVLERTLTKLEAEKSRTEKEIRAVMAALAALGVANPRLAVRRKRRPMDAAERRAVSRRMKTYWAKKRKQLTGKSRP
jgi:hypothetical protein